MVRITANNIKEGLNLLGLDVGSIVLVHSSLSRFGFVEGGADAVIDALVATVGMSGTVMVPTLTGNETLSSENPPTFDPEDTPSWTGVITETFRKRSDSIRSLHPTHSIAAIGADAKALTKDHFNSITPCDKLSPYGKLAQQTNAYILLLGVDHSVNTTLHHIEEMVGVDYHMQEGLVRCTMILGSEKVQRYYMLHKYGADRQFNIIDPLLTERGIQMITRIGNAEIRLVKAQQMVKLVAKCLLADQRFLCV